MKVLKITKYLNYTEINNTGKTLVIGVGNNNDEKLGIIKWRSSWRKYVFEPESDTVWDESCLNDVISFIKDLMNDRK